MLLGRLITRRILVRDTMPFTMHDEPDPEIVLFTVSRKVAEAAIAQVASCEAYSPGAVRFSERSARLVST